MFSVKLGSYDEYNGTDGDYNFQGWSDDFIDAFIEGYSNVKGSSLFLTPFLYIR